MTRRILPLLCALLLPFVRDAASAAVTNSLTLTIDASNPGVAIPANFIGLSVSSRSIDGDGGYTRCFTTNNAQMANLFRQIGVKHLRTIMGNAQSIYPDPSNAQIDSFFDFAAAAGVTGIIWSLHLFDTETDANWSNNKAVAAHIWSTTTAVGTVESSLLESFAFDNEPDWLRYICCTDTNITGYSAPAATGGYLGTWNQWRESIAAIAPGAAFSGPDTGSKWPCPGDINTSIGGVPFTKRFATDAASSIAMATQHFYGQTGISNLTTLQLAEACLSRGWLETNYALINSNIVSGLTVPYRFTECSAFDNEKNPGNQCFATALWALDFYHWWARHGCAGVDPFTRTVQFNSPIYFDGTNYIAEPYAYAMKAFALGSGGNAIYTGKFTISNPANANVTAYGVVNSNHLYVTVINKTFNSVGSVAADVTIPAPAGFKVQAARYIVLSGGPVAGSSGNATMTGACLGGAEIPNDGSAWAGQWTALPVSQGGVRLLVEPTTAVVIDLQNYPLLGLGSPALNAGGLRLSISAPAGSNVVVQASTNLADWTPVWTNSGSFDFTESNVAGVPSRFFRATTP